MPERRPLSQILLSFIAGAAFVGLTLLAVGLSYATYSLAKFLEASFSLFILGLVGFIFILVAVILLLLTIPKS